ncbi:MAG: polyprenyl synthetase family protein [bacterium]
MEDISGLIEFIRKEFNKSLNSFSFPKSPSYLYRPIEYSLKGKGKRYRPIIVHLTGRHFKSDPDDIMKISMAIELLHCFTLIHDDIMDSDDKRRNMPTLHKKYDVPSAILAGDGIFTITQLILLSVDQNSKLLFQKYNEMVLEICEGQAMDKQYEVEDELDIDDYIEMVKKKTGALLGSCLSLPAIIENEKQGNVELLYNIGKNLGVAFQIQDDLFEIFGDEKVMGKSLGSDIASNKKTPLAILAKNEDKMRWEKLVDEYDGKNLDNIRKFLIQSGVKNKVDKIAFDYFSNAYDSLSKFGIGNNSELYSFFKFIQERHY